jgi:SAM-dependent methyltransferase
MTDPGRATKLNIRSKRVVRAVTDRVMAPYVARLSEEIRASSQGLTASGESPSTPHPADVNVPSDFFHMALHELRTIELERSRGEYERVVSVGASGRWYFDWVERSIGEVVEHVGVEAFEPEPNDLPPYATWIATTADRFDGIADDDVDLVFAGQTTEHLWSEELAAFLMQSRRVLRDDGVLVLDSPNRLVTEELHWSHGGHSVELSPAEISELVRLAGFEVESVRGVWRCRLDGGVLELEDQVNDGAVLVRRVSDGADVPDDCFVWWLTARPSGPPDEEALLERAELLYESHWPTRLCRGMWPGPGAPGPTVVPGAPLRIESLPFMLRPGRLRIGLQTAVGDPRNITDATLEISLPAENLVHRLEISDAVADASGIWWEVEQPTLMFALTLVVRINSVSSEVQLKMPLAIAAISAVELEKRELLT